MSLEDRALTEAQKEEVIGKVLSAWKRLKYLRLGQLLIAANQGDLFVTEDFVLVERIEKFLKDHPES
jgi:hypothetical protein